MINIFIKNMIEIQIITTSHFAEQISDQLMMQGAAVVTLQDGGDQSIYEPLPGELIMWDHLKMSVIYETDLLPADTMSYLQEQQDLQRLQRFHVHSIVDQNWLLHNQSQMTPTQFGKKLWLCPEGYQIPHSHAVKVTFNAGLAFGTGSHATTALCLEWLDENIHGGETLIDYGCGSGILAVAALRLGAAYAVAVDHDPQALIACRMNGELNQCTVDQLAIFLPKQVPIQQKADILVANILAGPLIELAPYFASLLKSKGKIVLSGIMKEQQEEVIAVYQQWFSIKGITPKDEWIRLEACTNE